MFPATIARLNQLQALDGGLVQEHRVVNVIGGKGADMAQSGFLGFVAGNGSRHRRQKLHSRKIFASESFQRTGFEMLQ